MENATKALLIAAAVLVVILIITLGLVVYNRASRTAEEAGDLSEYQIQVFNEKFRKYEGTNVTGSAVNGMLKTVLNHNLAQEDSSTCVAVKFREEIWISSTQTTFMDATILADNNSAGVLPSGVSTAKNYKIECEYSTTSKIIKIIYVTEN